MAISKTLKNEALVLRRFRHGESSLIVHAFTRDFGRVAFIAKGARAGGKRMPVPIVPVVLLEFVWRQSTKSELQILREASLLEGYGKIHKNFDHLIWAQAAIEVLSRTVTGEEKNEELFDEILEFLELLNNAPEKIENLFIKFRLQVLHHLGYGISTQLHDNNSNTLFFVPRDGKVVIQREGIDGSLPVKLGPWKILHMINSSDYGNIKRIRIDNNSNREIKNVLDAAYRYHFEKWPTLESLKILSYTKENP